MSNIENEIDTRAGWDDVPFDAQMVFPAIPAGLKTSSLHASISPSPATGSVIVHGRLANGQTGSVRLSGRIYAAKLPFSDGTLRIQYLGETKSAQLNLESYVPAHLPN